MSKPILAIVGRPNVGKSTLFNRLVGRRNAIVEDMPGVTRDRQYGEGEILSKQFVAIDTGGFEPESTDRLLTAMREQAQIAIDEADVILVLFDGQAGLVPADREITRMITRSKKPVHFAVNKIDGVRHDPLVAEFWELGVHMLWPISAQHGGGVYDLFEAIAEDLPDVDVEDEDEEVTKVAVVGKPNAGKSTLLNKLLGEERVLVSDIPGTTRDSIDTALERVDEEGLTRRYVVIDTAGVRRRKWVKTVVEKISIVRTFKSIDRADVCLLMIDALEGVTDQDQKIARLVADKGRGCVVLVNKWDALPEKDDRSFGTVVKDLKEQLNFIGWAPILSISALTGQRTHKILSLVDQAASNRLRRIGTGELNRFLSQVLQQHTPPVHRNRRLKVYYGTQVSAAPPVFVLWVNDSEALSPSYQRFLLNRMREHWDFEGTPVKLVARVRKGKSVEERLEAKAAKVRPEIVDGDAHDEPVWIGEEVDEDAEAAWQDDAAEIGWDEWDDEGED
ncbi:MAG: ribosome biogenesis GTPase Der [Deltaproteobacteria bacterium]|nr:MAG: ribosome biogenesis GTPase Der [Deltaproteobacteria bacterium]